MPRSRKSVSIYFAPTVAAVLLGILIVLRASGAWLPAVQVGAFILALVALGFAFLDMLVRDIRHSYRHTIEARAIMLGVMVLETVALFAVTYLTVSQLPDEMSGLKTVLDSVYFTMTTLMTIGFGDVSAQGQLARAVVLTQMLFTILVLSSSVRLLSSLVRNMTKDVK